MIGLMAPMKHHQSVSIALQPAKTRPPPPPPHNSTYFRCSALVKIWDFGSAGDFDDWRRRRKTHLGAAGILARMHFFPLLGLADSMRGRGVSDLVGGIVHGPQ